MFNEFDVFRKYKKEPLEDRNLYYVKTKKLSILFNKTYNKIYGKYLKDYKQDVDILYVKKPSSYKKVNFKKHVEELWNTHISDNKD